MKNNNESYNDLCRKQKKLLKALKKDSTNEYIISELNLLNKKLKQIDKLI